MLNSLPLFVGLRYVRARSHKFFVSFITWVSLLCVCLGVTALIVILSVMTLAWIATLHWQSRQLATSAPDLRLLLEGTVISIPARAGNEISFDTQVRVLEGPGADGRWRRARLAWRDPAAVPRVGERWQWLVRLGSATELRNFHGPDTGRMWYSRRAPWWLVPLSALYGVIMRGVS